MKIHDGVISYRLLNNASILESHKQLISQSNTTRFQICSYEETMFAKKECLQKQLKQSRLIVNYQNFGAKFDSNNSSLKEEIYFNDRKINLQKKLPS